MCELFSSLWTEVGYHSFHVQHHTCIFSMENLLHRTTALLYLIEFAFFKSPKFQQSLLWNIQSETFFFFWDIFLSLEKCPSASTRHLKPLVTTSHRFESISASCSSGFTVTNISGHTVFTQQQVVESLQQSPYNAGLMRLLWQDWVVKSKLKICTMWNITICTLVW